MTLMCNSFVCAFFPFFSVMMDRLFKKAFDFKVRLPLPKMNYCFCVCYASAIVISKTINKI